MQRIGSSVQYRWIADPDADRLDLAANHCLQGVPLPVARSQSTKNTSPRVAGFTNGSRSVPVMSNAAGL